MTSIGRPKAASPYLQIFAPTWEGDFPSEGCRGNSAQNDHFVNLVNAQHLSNIPVNGRQSLCLQNAAFSMKCAGKQSL